MTSSLVAIFKPKEAAAKLATWLRFPPPGIPPESGEPDLKMGDRKAEEGKKPESSKGGPLPSSSRYSWKNLLTPLELRTLSASLILLGLVVLLISVNTDNWISDSKVNVGLWSACMQPGCATDAEGIALGKETLQVTRGMLVTALLFACTSAILISVSFCRNRIFSFSLGLISGTASIAASVFVMIGMSVYTNQLYEEKLDSEVVAEWSFDAGWVSFPLLFLAGSLTVILFYIES